jgi:hypothetical protein
VKDLGSKHRKILFIYTESMLIISRIEEDSYFELYRSEIVEGFTASWCPFRIHLKDLCETDLSSEIVIECVQRDAAHGFIPVGSTLVRNKVGFDF